MNREELEQSEEMSMRSVPFPEVVAKLAAAGVETYYTDLVQHQKVFYDGGGGSATHAMSLGDAGAIAPRFATAEVRAAVAAIQTGQITYPEFLRRIMRAGTMSYLVFIRGRRVIYLGRDGESLVEPFPSARP